jgi:hypothetical protein
MEAKSGGGNRVSGDSGDDGEGIAVEAGKQVWIAPKEKAKADPDRQRLAKEAKRRREENEQSEALYQALCKQAKGTVTLADWKLLLWKVSGYLRVPRPEKITNANLAKWVVTLTYEDADVKELQAGAKRWGVKLPEAQPARTKHRGK